MEDVWTYNIFYSSSSIIKVVKLRSRDV